MWLHDLCTSRSYDLRSLSYIICTDNYLLSINQTYLQHDDLTDVISFPYATTPGVIEGEVYVSLDRVRENASLYQDTVRRELLRVMVHGLLHFLGEDDKGTAAAAKMRTAEDEALSRLPPEVLDH